MRVLLHLQSTLRSLTGVGHYTSELYRCLREQAPGEIRGSLPQWLFRTYQQLNLQRSTARCVLTLPLLAMLKSCQWATLRAGAFDLYHEPNFIPRPSSLPTVTTIHDLSLLRYPQWHPEKRVGWYERGFNRALQQSVHFLTVSEAIRQEIISTLGVSPSRVTCVHNGVRPWLRPLPEAEVRAGLRTLGLPPRYLLYVGTIEPRKNVLTLLKAYCDLPPSLREGCPLVLAGGWGWQTEDVADFYESRAKHSHVVRLGYVAEKDLALLYNGARALVYPSLYEGFGLPPLEMLACGGAVLASTAEAIAEVVGGQAHLIEPRDVAGWRDALRLTLTDDDWWMGLRRGAVEHARPFTWERCAAQVLKVYRHVAAGHYDCAAPPAVLKTA